MDRAIEITAVDNRRAMKGESKMNPKPVEPKEPPDDPVYLNARKEGLVAFFAWVVAGIYTICFCYFRGYDLDADQVTTVFGIPSWVIWGIFVPWIAAIAFGIWFSMFFIKDEDLGSSPEDQADE